MIYYTIPINITHGEYPPMVYLSQYDSLFTLYFDLYASGGDLVIASETTAAIRGTKTDGNGYSANATLSGNRVTVTGDPQITAVPGDNIFELVLTKGNKELSTVNFIIHVERAALDKDTLASGSKIRELVDVIDRTDEIVDAAHAIDSAMANFNEQVALVQTARDEAVNAASTAASDVHAQLADDIAAVTSAKNYIDQYIEGLVYGDEVSY